MSELKPCEAIEILESIYPSKKQIVTGEYPEVAEALDMAIAAILRAQPANEPLTLDELREMDGEPVWVVDAGASENNGWHLVNLKYEPFFDKPDVTWEALMGNDGQYFTMCQVGNGLIAYRTKPEPPERS